MNKNEFPCKLFEVQWVVKCVFLRKNVFWTEGFVTTQMLFLTVVKFQPRDSPSGSLCVDHCQRWLIRNDTSDRVNAVLIQTLGQTTRRHSPKTEELGRRKLIYHAYLRKYLTIYGKGLEINEKGVCKGFFEFQHWLYACMGVYGCRVVVEDTSQT